MTKEGRKGTKEEGPETGTKLGTRNGDAARGTEKGTRRKRGRDEKGTEIIIHSKELSPSPFPPHSKTIISVPFSPRGINYTLHKYLIPGDKDYSVDYYPPGGGPPQDEKGTGDNYSLKNNYLRPLFLPTQKQLSPSPFSLPAT